MRAPYPFGFIGDSITRCVLLALPSGTVRGLLPASLEMLEQSVTPPGTHPVVMLFHSFVNCQFSFPTFLQPMNFREQTLGIPYTSVRAPGASTEAYYFMPKLYLDDPWVWMIGRNYWGFDKEMARVDSSSNAYRIINQAGRCLASLTWSYGPEEALPAMVGYREFDPLRLMLSQPLISFPPAAAGPVPALTDFDRNWNLATIRPLRSVLEIDRYYLPGFENACYPASPGPERMHMKQAPTCSYELSGPWWLSFPYFPGPNRRQGPAPYTA